MSGFTDELGSNWDLSYYIQTENSEDQTFYGIKIERTSSEETKGITKSYEQAEKWARAMAAGALSPLALHDYIDDLVG